MDRLSLLPDDLVIKILSFVKTKDAVTTSLLSKRWCSLWKHVPMLQYEDPKYGDPTCEFWRPSRFIDRFLLLHRAPVLETLKLALGRTCPSTNIETWIGIAVSRGLRYLEIFRCIPNSVPIRFPRSLFTYETLEILCLLGDVTVDDVPLTVCFRSLKIFVFGLVKFSSDDVVHRILSGCPVLEDLKVIRGSNDNVKTFTIKVPSLKRLTILDVKSGSHVPGVDVGFVINAPSLKSLTIANHFSWCDSLVKMPYLMNADIKLRPGDSNKFEGFLTSAKHVSLCLQSPMVSCPIGVFKQLVSLNICMCSLDWFRLLRHAPKLRVLIFEPRQVILCPNLNYLYRCCSRSIDVQTQWDQPGYVPQCLVSSLQKVELVDYVGTQAEKKVLMYLLENSEQLQTMAIRSSQSSNSEEKLKMLQEISSTQRSSRKCQILFT